MKKRSIALVMAGLMTAVSLAGCAGNSSSDTADAGGAKTEAAGSGTETGGQKSLTVAWWGNQVRNERTQEALDKYSELNPGVTLDDSSLSGGITGISWQRRPREILFLM